MLEDVIDAEVLVLDDLGGEKSGQWGLSMLYHVINERYNERRTTIITTSFPWDVPPSVSPVQRSTPAAEIMKRTTLRDRISERIYSPIAEMCPHRLELHGTHYRKTKYPQPTSSPFVPTRPVPPH